MEPIKSLHNPLVKYLLKMNKKRFREQEGKFVVEGARFVEEALASGWPVEGVIYSPGVLKSGRGADVVAAAASRNIKTIPVDENVMARLAGTEAPQGILALCGMKNRTLEEVAGLRKAGGGQQDILLVVVDGISDPGNLGTIIRSAHAFGADGAVLLKGTVDLYNDKTLRSTMGSVFHLPVVQGAGAADLDRLIREGMFLLVGVPRGGAPVDRLDAFRPLGLVVGSESAGPSGEILSLPHQKVTIPMPGRAESLNAAVAASIMIYQVSRLRSLKNF